ncbi:MAG: hypothetical protein QNJ30_23835 [Kiloniellales bacterium]|nr:hypothetical protein [Kiloniellales bacterium]
METVEILLKSIGAIVLSATSIVGVAYWLFRLFSDKWLTAKFAERLEVHKHAQQKELENIRFEINKLMDRTVKLHQREYDALPEAWSLLVDAHGITKAAISPLQKFPDVSRMNQAQLDLLLSESSLPKWEVAELKVAKDKNRYYQDAQNWHMTTNALDAAQKFHIFRLKNRIFLLPQINKKLEMIDDLIFKAIVERQLQLQEESYPKKNEARQKLEDEGEEIMKELAIDIQDRLWS